MSEAKSKTINELTNQFNEIIEWFDQENVDVEQATEKFDEGVKLAEAIKAKLDKSENKVNLIEKRLVDYESKQI